MHLTKGNYTLYKMGLQAAYNGGEVVISQDHITGFLGNFCAGDAHGDSNVC